MPRPLGFFLFFGVLLLVVGGGHAYLWMRLVRDTALPLPWARAATVLIAALALLLPAGLFASRLLPGDALRPLWFLLFGWMGVGFLLVVWVGASDLVGLVSRAASPELADPARRAWLSRWLAAGALSGTAAVSAWGVREALSALRTRHLTVHLANLPAELAGLRIVQISDVHIGPLLRREWLEGVVARISALSPDLIAITGDLVDGSVSELAEQVAPLARLSAPRGVWFVTGNHEAYSGAREWLSHLPQLGVRPLENERVEVAPGLDLAGVHDPTLGPDLEKALAGRDRSRPLILLAHQPRQFAEAARAGVDLTLSGHTHGGQIWPFNYLVALANRFVAGHYQEGAAQLYVSRGTGFWGPPLRVLAPSEITLLELRPA